MESSSRSNQTSNSFGQASDERFNFPVTTGGRNQYVELEHFDSDEHFHQWMQSQGKKWGIVQKGRITVEDIIDQYACVYRRRKGYACRVQMRVRHNRRNGNKVVEVLPLAHDHTFYGSALPNEFDDCISMVNQQSMVDGFDSSFGSIGKHFSAEKDDQQLMDDNKFDNEIKQEELDFTALLEQVDAGVEQTPQPMEMLWSNILNNPAIQQFANGSMQEDDFHQLQQQQLTEHQNNGDEATNSQMDETEALTNVMAEKVAKYLALQLEPKFASIFTVIGELAKSVDELKSSSSTQNQKPCLPTHQQRTSMVNQQNGRTNRSFQLQSELQSIQTSSSNQQNRPNIPQRPQQQIFPNNSTNGLKDLPALTPSLKATPLTNQQETSVSQKRQLLAPSKREFPQQKQTTAFRAALPLSVRASNMLANKAKFGLGLSINSPVKSSRKSVAIYRQRRRELSYRFMKEVGMSLTINGCTKSIFLWRASEISTACQAKRRELADNGKRVIYRGTDVTEKLYRVDCSRDLVNGRRCGQMIADSLWPRGYFQRRMLMPILKGVSHRSKKRGDGSARKPVACDQFEIFKVALLLLGGFLMEEADRSKWMETGREGVNQRGLDELANSKRAHYEYDGGPLFGFDTEEDGDGEDDAGSGVGANEEMDVEKQESGEASEQRIEVQPAISRTPVNLEFLRSYYEHPEEDGLENPPIYQSDEDVEEDEDFTNG